MWGIGELADLAGTSRRAVRHYNQIGLLAPPTRQANGYKQYDTTHLDRLLQIRRLTDLGFSLSRIANLDGDGERWRDAVRSVDADLAGSIERLQQARTELGLILADGTPTELPSGFPPTITGGLSDADRSFVVVMSRVLGPRALQDYTAFLRNLPTDPASRAFETLPADADDRTCRDVAARMVPVVRDIHAAYPALRNMYADSPHGPAFASRASETAKRDLYNAAQLDVLDRITALLARAP